MSYKVTPFTAAITQPLTLSRYMVVIPKLAIASMFVESAQWPTTPWQETAIYADGQPFYVPTRKLQSGEWSCSLYESAAAAAALFIEMLDGSIRSSHKRPDMSQVVNTESLIWAPLKGGVVKDPTVYFNPVDIFVCLTDAFTGIAPVKSVILSNAFLKSVDSINLESSKPGDPLKWKLNFRFNSIKKWQ